MFGFGRIKNRNRLLRLREIDIFRSIGGGHVEMSERSFPEACRLLHEDPGSVHYATFKFVDQDGEEAIISLVLRDGKVYLASGPLDSHNVAVELSPLSEVTLAI